jgi:hypothetical protein
VDPSALIFVALAVAWAVYLIPKALEHHDEVVRSRSVDRFSHRMRVLARREPVNRRDARLVVTPGRAATAPTVETKPSHTAAAPAAPVSAAARRSAANKAARRRRNVLALVLLANTVVVGLAVAKVVAWPYAAIPAGLLVAWLVACRVMVKGERRRFAVPARSTVEVEVEVAEEFDATSETPVVPAVEVPAAEVPAAVVGAWDMMPTTLPTYVSKPPAARRTVQTIDLESTGVWSSGRNDGDSALAREAEQADRVERASRDAASERRATGS